MPVACTQDPDVLAVAPKKACWMLDCSITRLYELLNSKEIESYRDGKSRRVLVASLRSYVARQCAAEDTKPRSGWTDLATKARTAKKIERNAIRTPRAKGRRR
jgi:hypothetical protein